MSKNERKEGIFVQSSNGFWWLETMFELWLLTPSGQKTLTELKEEREARSSQQRKEK